ncbi:MAG: phenylacetic acid degradation protein [Deltaproteobacteria bacterium]|nr:MAG: phenylacetic acid degradation protein [Deltaproteobacteria bacterium]
MEALKNFSENDRYAKLSGIELINFSKGSAKAMMKVEQKHLNAVGIVHGGAIFTLADFVFAIASNSHGTVAVSINAHISNIKAVKSGVLYAEAKELSLGKKLGHYEVVVTDDSGDLVAIFQGMVYRKREKI